MKASAKPAFTLIELIVVMAIIVTLSVIGFVSYNSYVMDSRNAARDAQLNDIAKVIDQFIFINGIPPKCAANAVTTASDYCYFTNQTTYVAETVSGVNPKAKGTSSGWNPGTSSFGPDSEGILSADWNKLNLKNTPLDPRSVYFLYAYNGQKYVLLATRELNNGYAAMVKGNLSIEEQPSDVATNNNTADLNVLASAGGFGVQLDGHTVTNGVVGPSYPANPLAIKYNNFRSTVGGATATPPDGIASIPYFW